MEVDHDGQSRYLGRVQNGYNRFLRGSQAEKKRKKNRGATSIAIGGGEKMIWTSLKPLRSRFGVDDLKDPEI